jgi:hypothetical protein
LRSGLSSISQKKKDEKCGPLNVSAGNAANNAVGNLVFEPFHETCLTRSGHPAKGFASEMRRTPETQRLSLRIKKPAQRNLSIDDRRGD